MKPKFIPTLMVAASFALHGCATRVRPSGRADTDRSLTKQVCAALVECQKVKIGMTRADLLKIFMEEGGLSQARHRTYVYRNCSVIKVDVDFTLSSPTQRVNDKEEPSDIIIKLSKPYLDWNNAD